MTDNKLSDQEWRDLRADLLSAANGRWDYLAPQLAPALQSAADRMGKHVECPFPDGGHENSKKRFRLDEKSGMAFCTCRSVPIHAAVYQLSGMTHGWFLIELAKLLNMESSLPDAIKPRGASQAPVASVPPPKAPKPQTISEDERDKRLQGLKKALSRGVKPEPGGIVDAYMRHRGIPFFVDGDVYEVESQPYIVSVPEKHQDDITGRFATLGHFNAIVHVVRDKRGRPAGLNRIFVKDGRKITASDFQDLPKWVDPESDLPAKRRSNYLPFPEMEAYVVLRKGSGHGRFHACEGIECGWAIVASTDPRDTVVAHLSNVLLEKNSIVTPEKGYSSLWIWGDHDRSQTGDTSAARLLYRALGRDMPTRVMLPYGEIPEDEKSLDWDYIFKAHSLGNAPTWEDRLKVLYSYADKELFHYRKSIGDL